MMIKWWRAVCFAGLLLMLTSCASVNSPDKPDVPEEIQLLDTASGRVLYLGMKKNEVRANKLVKAEKEQDLSDSWESYQYEGVDMIFQDGELIMIHVPDTSKKGRFTTKGVGIGNDESEIISNYGKQPLHNPIYNTYEYILFRQENGLYYLKSLNELKRQDQDKLLCMLSFNLNEEGAIRSFNLIGEKYLNPNSYSSE